MKLTDLQLQQTIYPVRYKNTIKPGQSNKRISENKTNLTDRNFSDILNNKVSQGKDIKFSLHAMRRMDERRINLSKIDLSRLESGVNRVEGKGAKSSLILLDDTAYIVSVRNKTIVTALTKEAVLGNVFTNIDSVAIV